MAKDKRNRRAWLACPRCQHPHSEVLKVLTLAGRRQRRCLACRHDFLTVETLAVGNRIPVSVPAIETAIRSTPTPATRV